jgi:hypothetical protein
MHERNRRRESGSALFIAVMMLVLMGALGIVALDSVTTDRQVAGLQNRAVNAFYTAEAALAEARSLVEEVGSRSSTPTFHTEAAPYELGDTALYDREGDQPKYYGDPAFADPIRWIGDSGGGMAGGNLQVGKQKLMETLWQINVVGESPTGARSRVEVVEVKVLSQGY